MEQWQRKHILDNLVELVKATICTAELTASLKSKKLLSRSDVESLELPHLTSFQKSNRLYEILQTRTNAYDALIDSLKETSQTGAVKILRNHNPIFSNYGGIRIDKNHVLGTGCSGTKVFKGTTGGRDVAVKVINCDFIQPEVALQEVEFLKRVDSHENIVRYFTVEAVDNFIYIALELCKISLQDEIKLEMLNVRPVSILKKCTKGLTHLHKLNIIHRDMKPANVLLNHNDQVKISDFGLSKQIPVGMSSVSVHAGVVGTADWMAPEVLIESITEDDTPGQKIRMSTSSDIFSLGCIFAFVLSKGTHPFGRTTVARQYNICNYKPQLEKLNLEQSWLQLVEKMISSNPKERPFGEEVLASSCFKLREEAQNTEAEVVTAELDPGTDSVAADHGSSDYFIRNLTSEVQVLRELLKRTRHSSSGSGEHGHFEDDDTDTDERTNSFSDAESETSDKSNAVLRQQALDKQGEAMERHFQALLRTLDASSSTGGEHPYVFGGAVEADVPSSVMDPLKLQQQIRLLNVAIAKAKEIVSVANKMTIEMGMSLPFRVKLVIPWQDLIPNQTHPEILVDACISLERNGYPPHNWEVEEFEEKLAGFRECSQSKMPIPLETYFQLPIVLFGIGNIFLDGVECDDIVIKYPVAIISQQGEVVGCLHVEVRKTSGHMEPSDERQSDSEPVTFQVTLRYLVGMKCRCSEVYCEYIFGENTGIITPKNIQPSYVTFDQTKHFTVSTTKKFMDDVKHIAISVKVFGTFKTVKETTEITEGCEDEVNKPSLEGRWKKVTNQLKLWVEIQELRDNGDYDPVEVENTDGPGSGGTYLLKQGRQRRILVSVEHVADTEDRLPLACDELTQVSLGAIISRSTLQRPLDSYQEDHLMLLREKYNENWTARRDPLNAELEILARKQEKSEEEIKKEGELVENWMALVAEKNEFLDLESNMCTATVTKDQGMEPHLPTVFLNISDVLSQDYYDTNNCIGLECLLPKEYDAKFVKLPVTDSSSFDLPAATGDDLSTATCNVTVSWDASVHDGQHLNQVTVTGEAVYMILRVTLRLALPVPMQVMLRKRLCVRVQRNRLTLVDRMRIKGYIPHPEVTKMNQGTGVIYNVIGSLPKSSEQLETLEQERLADLAVTNGGDYIEKFLRSVSNVHSILEKDRMRQSAYLHEEEQRIRGIEDGRRENK